MTSGCLDRKEVRGAIWGVHSTTDRPAGGNTGRLFLAFGGPVCADRISNCPLDRVLTYKNLIYLLNLQFPNFQKNFVSPKMAAILNFRNFAKIAKHKNAYISKTVLDRAISTKFLTRWISLQSSYPNFEKIFVSPKMAAILNFRIFRKNCKT